MARLPKVGGDDGSWGQILNDYLAESHDDDGTLKAGTVGSGQLKPNAVTSTAVANGSITNAKIADGAVGSAQISDGAIDEDHLDDGLRAQLSSGLADGSVTAVKLADDAVTTGAIATGAVTTAKLHDAGVANGPAILDDAGKLPASAVPMQAVADSSELKTTLSDPLGIRALLAQGSPLIRARGAGTPAAAPATSLSVAVTQDNTNDSTLTKIISGYAWDFFRSDGPWIQNGTQQAIAPGVTQSDGITRATLRQTVWREFSFDGRKLQLRFSSAPGLKLRIWVDGAAVTAALAPPPGGTTGTNQNLHVDLGSASPGKPRLIRIEFESQTTASPILWGNLSVAPTDSVWFPTVSSPRVMLVGDSYGLGVGAATFAEGYGPQLGRLLGFADFWTAATSIGSTGLVDTAPSYGAYITRLAQDVIPFAPDLLILQGSINDTSSINAGLIGPALTTYVNTLRAAVPKCRVIVLSPLYPAAPNGSIHQVGVEMLAAATAVGVPYIDFVEQGYFTGTGKVDAPAGDGNADIYRAADGVHPSQAGHAALAELVAGRILQRFTSAA